MLAFFRFNVGLQDLTGSTPCLKGSCPFLIHCLSWCGHTVASLLYSTFYPSPLPGTPVYPGTCYRNFQLMPSGVHPATTHLCHICSREGGRRERGAIRTSCGVPNPPRKQVCRAVLEMSSYSKNRPFVAKGDMIYPPLLIPGTL